VREIAGLAHRPTHGLFALIEERVEVVDNRLYLGNVAALEPAFTSLAHADKPGPQLGHARQPTPYLQRANHHRDTSQEEHEPGVRCPNEMDLAAPAENRHVRVPPEHPRYESEGKQDQTDGPQHGTEQDAGPQREIHAPIR
jgi:hypothetical protein